MGVLVSWAVAVLLTGAPSARPAGAVATTALSAPSRPHTPHWAPPAASVAPVLGRTRFSRRAGVSRVERGVTSLGARTIIAPHAAWTVLAGSGEWPARSRRTQAAFERGPPSLS